jgi:rhamnosyltransferase
MIEALAARMDTLEATGERVAVVGPRIVSPVGTDFKAPRYFPRPGVAAHAGAKPVHYVISSGSLIDLRTLRDVGPFRADFFIDAIDTEWCFRAWTHGASCWTADEVTMIHRIGAGVVRVRGLGNATPRQPEFRLYAYVRNQAHCLTLAHIPLAWKARFAAHLVRVVLVSWIDRGGRLSFLGAMMQAAWRGFRGRLGPPPGASGLASVD